MFCFGIVFGFFDCFEYCVVVIGYESVYFLCIGVECWRIFGSFENFELVVGVCIDEK